MYAYLNVLVSVFQQVQLTSSSSSVSAYWRIPSPDCPLRTSPSVPHCWCLQERANCRCTQTGVVYSSFVLFTGPAQSLVRPVNHETVYKTLHGPRVGSGPDRHATGRAAECTEAIVQKSNFT